MRTITLVPLQRPALVLTRRALTWWPRYRQADERGRRHLATIWPLAEAEAQALQRFAENARQVAGTGSWFQDVRHGHVRLKDHVRTALFAGLYVPEDALPDLCRACVGDREGWRAQALTEAVTELCASFWEQDRKRADERHTRASQRDAARLQAEAETLVADLPLEIRSLNRMERLARAVDAQGIDLRQAVPAMAVRSLAFAAGMTYEDAVDLIGHLRRKRGIAVRKGERPPEATQPLSARTGAEDGQPAARSAGDHETTETDMPTTPAANGAAKPKKRWITSATLFEDVCDVLHERYGTLTVPNMAWKEQQSIASVLGCSATSVGNAVTDLKNGRRPEKTAAAAPDPEPDAEPESAPAEPQVTLYPLRAAESTPPPPLLAPEEQPAPQVAFSEPDPEGAPASVSDATPNETVVEELRQRIAVEATRADQAEGRVRTLEASVNELSEQIVRLGQEAAQRADALNAYEDQRVVLRDKLEAAEEALADEREQVARLRSTLQAQEAELTRLRALETTVELHEERRQTAEQLLADATDEARQAKAERDRAHQQLADVATFLHDALAAVGLPITEAPAWEQAAAAIEWLARERDTYFNRDLARHSRDGELDDQLRRLQGMLEGAETSIRELEAQNQHLRQTAQVLMHPDGGHAPAEPPPAAAPNGLPARPAPFAPLREALFMRACDRMLSLSEAVDTSPEQSVYLVCEVFNATRPDAALETVQGVMP